MLLNDQMKHIISICASHLHNSRRLCKTLCTYTVGICSSIAGGKRVNLELRQCKIGIQFKIDSLNT